MRAIAFVLGFAALEAFAQAGHGQPAGAPLPSLLDRAAEAVLEADGTLSWRALAAITNTRHENTDGRYGPGVAYFLEPTVAGPVRALEGRTVRVRGYLLPRVPEGGKTHFQVSALPAVDADGCTLGATENSVDVISELPVEATVNRMVIVEGTLAFFDAQRWNGYVYRLAAARVVE